LPKLIDSLPSFTRLNEKQRIELLRLENLKIKWQKENKIESYYPDKGPFRRELYKKHMEFFKAGATYRERCFMAANRIGKTEGAGGIEVVYHATGNYPHWWEGKRFDSPCRIMCSGNTGITTRDIIQAKLFGNYDDPGEALLPKASIGDKVPKSGIPRAFDSVKIKHESGGWSNLFLRSYESGRKIFEGVELELFWADEECPLDVYSEGLMRMATTGGISMLTFTPLRGLTELVLSFLGSEFRPPETKK